MKNLFLIMVAFLGFSFASVAQKAVFTEGKAELINSKKSGNYSFTFPEDTDAEELKTFASYYTDYFTVSYDEDSKKVELVMVENTEINRRIITRFLGSSGIETVVVGDSKLTLDDFFGTYLQ
jgi:hypothetical protein